MDERVSVKGKTCHHLWQWMAIIICTAFFTLQVSISFKELLSYSTYSSLQISDEDPIPAAAITVCPHRPWSVPALVHAGINTSCLDIYNCVFDVLYTLQGYVRPPLPFQWQEVELQADEIIAKVEWAGEEVNNANWSRVSLASMPCYTWHPHYNFRHLDSDVASVTFTSGDVITDCPGMSFKTCQETITDCSVDCGTRLLQYYRQFGDQSFLVILHSTDEEPLPGLLQPVTTVSFPQAVTMKLEYEAIVKVNIPSSPCRPPGIHSQCLRQCYIREVVHASNCTFRGSKDSISCPHVAAWEELWKMEEAALLGKMEWWNQCGHCGSSCQQRVYHLSQQEKVWMGGPSLHVQMNTMLHKQVVSNKAYTATNFLADVGGGMGLWLGTCGFSLALALINYLRNISSHWRKLRMMCCDGVDDDGLGMRVRDESMKMKATKESVKSLKARTAKQKDLLAHNQHGPAGRGTVTTFLRYPTSTLILLTHEAVPDPYITLCSEVPFSLHSLVQMGFNNSDESCKESRDRNDGDLVIMVCNLEEMINPLLEQLSGFSGNLSVQQVWDSARLPQHHLVTQYSSTIMNKWRPVLTDHNTCYKHINYAISLSEHILSLEMTDQYENFNCSYLFPTTVCKWMRYHGNLRAINLLVTPYGDTSRLVSQDLNHKWEIIPGKTCYQYSGCLRELIVSYTVRQLISTPTAPCTSTPGYSYRNCIEDCVLRTLFNERGCAPPYLPDTELIQCSVAKMRSGLMKVSRQDVITKEHKCYKVCPHQCDQTFLKIRPFYSDVGTQDAVVVRRDGSPHTVTREKLLWPLNRAVCEIGGALGLYLGLSVLSLLQAAFSLLSRCISSAMNRCMKWLPSLWRQGNSISFRKMTTFPKPIPTTNNYPHPGLGSLAFSHTFTPNDYNDIQDHTESYVGPPDADLTVDTKDSGVNVGNIQHYASFISPQIFPNSFTTKQILPKPLLGMTEDEEISLHDKTREWCTNIIWTMVAALPCAVIFSGMALLQWQEYASDPVFTSYETHYMTDLVFPGVTFCVFPPFNPKRLAELGITYNFSHHCYKDYDGINWKVKCDWLGVYEELLEELPGAWPRPLHQIWEDAAWRPTDLFISYSLGKENYQVKNEEDPEAPLQPSLTALNRCFTFTSPSTLVRPNTVLAIKLTKLANEYRGLERCTDAKYYWNLDNMYLPGSIHDFWKCYQDQFKMHILVHPPGQQPFLLEGITSNQLKLTSNTVRMRVEMSLDIYERLRTDSLPCVTSAKVPGGSRGTCIQRCLAEATVKQFGCRLPYVTWLSAPLCSRRQYKDYPKYQNKVLESVGNKSQVAGKCQASCPETCRVLHYTTTDTASTNTNIEVAFTRPMYNQVQESWAYSTTQLVSNVGSLASLFLGVSLYQLLTCCLHHNTH
ncbi:hypothetical protein Pcinc_029689 [Petrolisthes cinctipes]|uniref:Uncharacterized protein n=1 Tax=Petrolisthes cinctipes TaxID=88211 RepID=A0AAE1K5D7_PETCI|nr:hypothetical protein Pcinc_029689 [Petrolisthes cinctipes]